MMVRLLYEKKEVGYMKKTVTKRTISTAVIALLGLIVAGCAPQTGRTTKSYYENLRFVPSIHVEDNSFGVTSGAEYWGCSYDQLYAGYWCSEN